MRGTLHRFARWLYAKTVPYGLTGSQWTGTGFVDSYKRNRNPTPNELQAELKGIAWSCASINAATCANNPPGLYVLTRPHHPKPKCHTLPISGVLEKRLRSHPRLKERLKSVASGQIGQVTEHPLLDLLATPNPCLGSFDLWELTTLYQEVHGSAYWYLDFDPMLGVPASVWVLPAQNMTPRREPDSRNIVDYYLYRTGGREQRFSPQEIVHFRYPDPRDPYTSGLSPLRACFEQVALVSDYAAFKKAKFENHAVPDAIISPREVIGEEERDRLETQWNQRFRRGGSGRVVVADASLDIKLLQESLGDVALLAELGATKELIANAFHCPIAFFTANTNLANLQAARGQHADQAISPRLERRDERLNSQLVPLFDPTGRLFFASEDPRPSDNDAVLAEREQNLKFGVVTINERRSESGMPPVPWGDVPWLPLNWERTDQPRRPVEEPTTGRNKPDKDSAS